MKKGLTEIVFILDESGSMYDLKSDTIGGFNSVLEKQRSETEAGEAFVSAVMFSDSSRVVHDRRPISEVPCLTSADYEPSGSTALLDALGGAIKHISDIHKYARPEDVPENTLFVITTDGIENASRTYSAEKVRKMITEKQKKHGWEFIFLGANIDSVKTANAYGISDRNAVNYHADKKGTSVIYGTMNEAIRNVRANTPLAAAPWRKEADEDFSSR